MKCFVEVSLSTKISVLSGVQYHFAPTPGSVFVKVSLSTKIPGFARGVELFCGGVALGQNTGFALGFELFVKVSLSTKICVFALGVALIAYGSL